jgi:signal transduction histidine kinase
LSADADVATTVLDRLHAGEQVHGVETRYTHRDGSLLDVRVSAAPLCSQGSGFDGGVFVVDDITAQRQRAQRLAVLDRVLRHNIRNEVGVVQGHLEVLVDDLSGHDEHVTVMHERLSNIVELSDAARHLERLRGEGRSDLTTVDVGAVVRDQVDRLRTVHPHADVRASVPQSAPAVAHELFPSAVENVLENAVEHNDSDTPRVDVTVDVFDANERRRVRTSVVDDGPGLSAMEREVLASATETPLTHSDGIGLWLTRWIVRSSHGTLSVSAGHLGGTRVDLSVRVPPADVPNAL